MLQKGLSSWISCIAYFKVFLCLDPAPGTRAGVVAAECGGGVASSTDRRDAAAGGAAAAHLVRARPLAVRRPGAPQSLCVVISIYMDVAPVFLGAPVRH